MPSDICFASFGGEYNITAERSEAISLSHSENITPSDGEAYHLICICRHKCSACQEKKDGEHKKFSVLFLLVETYCSIADTPNVAFFNDDGDDGGGDANARFPIQRMPCIRCFHSSPSRFRFQ